MNLLVLNAILKIVAHKQAVLASSSTPSSPLFPVRTNSASSTQTQDQPSRASSRARSRSRRNSSEDQSEAELSRFMEMLLHSSGEREREMLIEMAQTGLLSVDNFEEIMLRIALARSISESQAASDGSERTAVIEEPTVNGNSIFLICISFAFLLFYLL